MTRLRINGETRRLDVPDDMPLLWALRDVAGLTVRNGAIREGNFDGYPLLRIDEAPREIDVHFVETETHPTGLGEPGLPPAAPALANAVYALTGRRHRTLPLDI